MLHRWEGSVELTFGDVAEDDLLVEWQRLSGLAVRQLFADFVCCFPLSWYMVFAVRRLQYIASLCVLTILDVVWVSPVGSVVLNDDLCCVSADCKHFALSVALA